ncbi:MAG: SIMPL domain-containing protein [Cyclobacteriaceae bacterium]
MSNKIIPSIITALGLALGGFFIGNGFFKARSLDRYVTVKGLAEKEVDADMAIWPIVFNEPGNNLKTVNSTIQSEARLIQDFLTRAGFGSEEVSIGVSTVTDNQATGYYAGNNQPFRYLGQGRITVNSEQVDLVRQTMSRLNELIDLGVVIAQENYDARVQFLFTRLNDIKPEMIEEATLNARQAAQKFAEDSGSDINKIRRADQGLFTISNRDLNSPHKKKVRVVTTIEYLLED